MLCSSNGTELLDFWSLRQRMALSMTAWSWGATAGMGADRGTEKPLKGAVAVSGGGCGCHL